MGVLRVVSQRLRSHTDCFLAPVKRGLAHFISAVTLWSMRFLRLTLLALLMPLGLAATALAEEKKPSLIYYYFDG